MKLSRLLAVDLVPLYEDDGHFHRVSLRPSLPRRLIILKSKYKKVGVFTADTDSKV